MEIDRPVSSKTWQEIDNLAWRIEERALNARDWQTAKEADRINALLRNLAIEISMENGKFGGSAAG